MTMLAKIGKDARFLALLLEALERALEVLVVMYDDFRQNLLPPFVAFVAPVVDRLPNLVPMGRRVNLEAMSCAARRGDEDAGGTRSARPLFPC